MTFPINLVDSIQADNLFYLLRLYGQTGCERIQIIKTNTGYCPTLTSAPGFIERILAFFGYKNKLLRLNEVAQFSLDWLKAHANAYPKEFLNHSGEIKILQSLMKKAKLEDDFNLFMKGFFERKEVLDISAEQSKKIVLPINIQNYNNIESSIKNVLQHYYRQPGTVIKREKKSFTIDLYTPWHGKVSYPLPVKTNFYLGPVEIPTRESFKESFINVQELFKQRIIIKTTELIAEGGERKVFRAIDILNNEELVYKKFVSPLERDLTKMVSQLPGFIPAVRMTNKHFVENRCIPLSSYFNSSPTIKRHIIKQLILGLKSMHKQKTSLSTTLNGRVLEFPNVPLYHADIKPANILTYGKNEMPTCGFSDLGGLCNLQNLGYTAFFRSPERASFIENRGYPNLERNANLSIEEIANHNILHGQSNDVWSLGIVIVTLLTGLTYDENSGIPQLKCFTEMMISYSKLTNQKLKVRGADRELINLTQERLDESINLVMKNCKDKELIPIWNTVKLMLKVDPKQRIKADDIQITW